MKRILSIWLPNWPIQRLVVARPELKYGRVVLFEQHPQRGQRVTAASPLARRDAVSSGMPLSEAKSLCRRGSDRSPAQASAVFLLHDPGLDLDTLRQLALSCDRFSPIVGLEQSTEPCSILLDVTGLARLFGGEQSLLDQVHDHFADRGYVVRAAIAPTIGMAWGLSRTGSGERGIRKKEELRNEDPPSSVPRGRGRWRTTSLPADPQELPAEEDGTPKKLSSFPFPVPSSPFPAPRSEFLSLPVTALRLAPTTVDTLHQLGIAHIGQLLKLPRASLQSRFGNEVTWRLDQMTGAVDEPIVALEQPAEFHVEQTLDYPTGHRQTIEVILSRLVRRICTQLYDQQRGALQWDIRLFAPAGPPVRLKINLFQPTATAEHVLPLLEMQMEAKEMRNAESETNGERGTGNGEKEIPIPKSSPIPQSKIQDPHSLSPPLPVPNSAFPSFPVENFFSFSVSVTNSVLLSERQRRLFDDNPRLDRQALAHLINRLSSRLGQQQVLAPRLASGAQAEFAGRFQPLVGTARRATGRSRSPALSPLERPLHLYPTPIELATVSLSAERPSSAALPGMLICNRQTLRIVRRWGPERIETGWWRGPTARRDYWRVETQNGRWLWIYRDLRKRKWFLHGEF